MTQFQDFIDFLRQSGVAKFSIEFGQPQQSVGSGVDQGKPGGDKTAVQTATRHEPREENVDLPQIHAERNLDKKPTTVTPIPPFVPEPAKADDIPVKLVPEPETGPDSTAFTRVFQNPDLAALTPVAKSEKPIETATVKLDTPIEVKKSDVEEKPEKSAVPLPELQKAAEPVKTVAKVVSASAGGSEVTYEQFIELVEKDSGQDPEVKREAIRRMKLDGLLQINADFQLGLDTDVPDEDLRSAVLASF